MSSNNTTTISGDSGNPRGTMRSSIITASAGSGKTYTITQKLAERIRGGLSPSAFIATTFTTKAAAELSSRIRTRLMSDGLTEEAQALDSALVGTVNAVSATLVRDFAIDAGLSPELETLTEDTAKQAFSLACDGIVADRENSHRDLIARVGYDKAVDAAEWDRGKSFAETVQDIADTARQNLISPEELRRSAAPSIESLMDVLDSLATAAATDERATWVGPALAGIKAAIACETPPKSATAEKRVAAFEKARSWSTDEWESLTWNAWARLMDAKVPGGGTTKTVAKAFTGACTLTGRDIAANPSYRADIAAMTNLVLDTAADCLVAYDEYKKALGFIDFTDQEVQALEVIRSSQSVRDAIAATYEVLVVDEFQDTNPIQLALFFELGQLAGEVIWVGDPKQSIYGFRGSDPSLMAAAIDALRENGDVTALDKSWRSHRQPLQLTNELFSAVMPDDPNVRLGIDESIAPKRDGGDVRLWDIGSPGRGNAVWLGSVAKGMRDLLEETGLPGGRTAVLARTKANVDAIVEKLTELGVACTGERTNLRTVREGQIIRAALAFLLDERDTRALVELIVLLDDHAAHETWFGQLESAPDREARREILSGWAHDPSLRHLQDLRAVAVNLTPVEIVRHSVDALDLRRRIAGWTNPAHRMTSLDAFTGMAAEYQDECRAGGSPVTLSGFLTWFDAADPRSSTTDDPDSVYVGTIHSSKGLEWEAVCVAVGDPKDRFTPDGYWVGSHRPPTIVDPLGDRYLRFWPAVTPDAALIVETMRRHPEQDARHKASIEDARRLSYVALTRAARHSILCPRKDFTDYDAVRGTKVTLTWTKDEPQLLVRKTKKSEGIPVPARIEAKTPADEDDLMVKRGTAHALGIDELRGDSTPRLHVGTVLSDDVPAATADSAAPATQAMAFPRPARITPSGLSATDAEKARAGVMTRASLGVPLVSGGDEKWELVGEAVHDYLALPLGVLDDGSKQSAADRLVASWGVGSLVDAGRLIETGRRWAEWLDAEYPGANIRSEVPVTWRNASHQVAEGWIDQLIETADGSLVLVDHKTYPGPEPEKHVREKYVGQLSGYADALELAGLGRPKEILVHLPLKGLVVSVRP